MKSERVILLTGEGKGKSSSALGMMLRAVGWEMRVCVIQFIKSASRKTGEERAAASLENVTWHSLGDGFTWITKNPQQDCATTRNAWLFCQETIVSENHDLVILDEILYAIHYGWLSEAEVATFIRHKKPPETHLILTGRHAPPKLIELADTVTEMQAVKHAYQQGVPAMRGIEF